MDSILFAKLKYFVGSTYKNYNLFALKVGYYLVFNLTVVLVNFGQG
jgi:hypothetical protein